MGHLGEICQNFKVFISKLLLKGMMILKKTEAHPIDYYVGFLLKDNF